MFPQSEIHLPLPEGVVPELAAVLPEASRRTCCGNSGKRKSEVFHVKHLFAAFLSLLAFLALAAPACADAWQDPPSYSRNWSPYFSWKEI